MELLSQLILFITTVFTFTYSLKSILRIKWPKIYLRANKTITDKSYPNILRKKDFEIYQGIKYGAGIKSASFHGNSLILIDLGLIKDVNQKDFNSFQDRHPPHNHPDPLMNKMLSFATGEEWKKLKSILTKAFSTSRIRRIYQCLDQTGCKMVNLMRDQIAKGSTELEIVGPTNKYLLELIACSVFGLEETGIFSSSNGDIDNSPFEIYTKEIQKAMTRHRKARLVPGLLSVAKLFNLIRLDPKAVQFFKSTIENSLKELKVSEENGDDLLQVLMEAISSDSATNCIEEMILPQAFMFFFAGTEGPATLLIYGMYELAMNPTIQQKLYDEVSGATEANNNDSFLDYENLTNLKYLDMFVSEVLRMYSSSVTARRCGTRYKVRNTNLTIEPGTSVHTPIYGIHHDHEYYPDPFKFNPDHFSEVAKTTRPQNAFMPFGIGPRSCIAQKLGLIQGKSILSHIVYNFRFETCWKTDIPPKGTLETMYLPPDGLWLKVMDRRT